LACDIKKKLNANDFSFGHLTLILLLQSQAERQFKSCVNGDFSFLWESQKFDPHSIKTPDPIKIKFSTVDYVGERTRRAKFYANPSKRGFPANG